MEREREKERKGWDIMGLGMLYFYQLISRQLRPLKYSFGSFAKYWKAIGSSLKLTRWHSIDILQMAMELNQNRTEAKTEIPHRLIQLHIIVFFIDFSFEIDLTNGLIFFTPFIAFFWESILFVFKSSLSIYVFVCVLCVIVCFSVFSMHRNQQKKVCDF